MYRAEGNCVYYVHPDDDHKELFLTINPNQRDSTQTPEEQAVIIAEMLNNV